MIGSDRFPVENVKLEIHFPDFIEAPRATVSTGTYSFVEGLGTWDIGKLVLDRASSFTATLPADVKDLERIKYQHLPVFLEFQVIGMSISKTRVEKL